MKIIHGEDYLLKKIPAYTVIGEYIGMVSLPVLEMLHNFMEKKIIGREFNNKDDLSVILDEWPKLIASHGTKPGDVYAYNELDMLNNLIICSEIIVGIIID